MKSYRGHIATFALGAFLFCQSNAEAMPRMWRSVCGTVDRVYQDQYTIILITAEKKKVMLITWKKKTRVYRNGKRMTEFKFEEGDRLCLRYRSPFFGKRWATNIAFTDDRDERYSKTGK